MRELEDIDADVVLFVDDNFAHDMDRVGAICDLMLARGMRKRYVVQARVEIAKRPDVLRKMERAGFLFVFLGIESAQDKTLRSMKKGFNTARLREYFRVLRRSRMILHGSFILGNIGETEEEMLQIAPFAHELGLDTIALPGLRNQRYSGLEELVARSPRYYITPGGAICSDEHPENRLHLIRHRIYRSFYTPGQMLRILRKSVRNGVLAPGMLARLPWFLARKSLETWKRRRARRKRERRAEREGRSAAKA